MYKLKEMVKRFPNGVSTCIIQIIIRNLVENSEAILLKKGKIKNRHALTPIKVYPYKSLQKFIEQLVRREGFLASCEKWRNRSVPDGYQCDIYDGHIWKIYNSAEGLHFLCCPHRWLLTLNVDWFQPFELGIHSVGAISMCIQNLTGDVRYRSENIILVGIMPGPKEAKKTINSFLTPLVYELQEAWNHAFSAMSPQNIPVRESSWLYHMWHVTFQPSERFVGSLVTMHY